MTVGHRNQRGKNHALFRGRSVLQNFGFLIHFSVQNIIHLPGFPAYQMGRLAQFKLTIFDQQINGLFRLAFDDNPIKASKLQFCREKPATLRVTDTATDRRFCICVDSTLTGDCRACCHTCHQSQDIFWSKRVCTFWHVAQNIIHTHRTSTHILAIEVFGWLLNCQHTFC